jgi:hypothetical protein
LARRVLWKEGKDEHGGRAMRPFEEFVEKTLEDFEVKLKARDMTESARRSCMTCAKEFAVYLMEGDSSRPKPS